MQDGLIHARRDVDTFAFTSADLAADPSLWPPPFAEAVIAALALRLARVITGSTPPPRPPRRHMPKP